MKTIVQNSAGIAREVKNLGWLLRHWREVSGFTFHTEHSETCGILTASLKCGGFYRTNFADTVVCFDFLRRPVFDTLNLTVRHKGKELTHVIGSQSYRTVLAAYHKPAPIVRGAYDNAGQYRATLAAILPQ